MVMLTCSEETATQSKVLTVFVANSAPQKRDLEWQECYDRLSAKPVRFGSIARVKGC